MRSSVASRFKCGLGLRIAFGLVALVAGASSQTAGPVNGSLVIVGGNMQDPAIFQRFIDLAGGPDAPIVVIPTAGGEKSYGPNWPGLTRLRKLGARNLTLVHTYNRDDSASDSFVEPIRKARAVWFPGGRQWRLADSYLNTKVHEELQSLLARGGVVGGSSAGATIQGAYLARGDTKTNTIMMGDHEEGFGFLTNVAIDQHLLRRNRQHDLLEVIRAKPHLLGIGIDEDTAIVVRGSKFEVIGQSYVAIYDSKRAIDTGGEFYFLAPGDHYDLATRQPLRERMELVPLERVVARP